MVSAQRPQGSKGLGGTQPAPPRLACPPIGCFVSVHDVHIWAAWSAPSCALAGAVPRPTRSAPRAPGGCRGERTRHGTGKRVSLGKTDRARALGRAWLCSLWLGKDQAFLQTTQLTSHSSRASARSSPNESISQTLRGSVSLTQSDLFPGYPPPMLTILVPTVRAPSRKILWLFHSSVGHDH